MNEPAQASREETYEVRRLDDNGNEFVVAANLSRTEAEQLVAMFEARGHKQTYWFTLATN